MEKRTKPIARRYWWHWSIQGDAPSANSDALDARAQIVDIGILNSDTLSIGLVIEQKDSGEAASFGAAFGGLTFGSFQNLSATAGAQDNKQQ